MRRLTITVEIEEGRTFSPESDPESVCDAIIDVIKRADENGYILNAITTDAPVSWALHGLYGDHDRKVGTVQGVTV